MFLIAHAYMPVDFQRWVWWHTTASSARRWLQQKDRRKLTKNKINSTPMLFTSTSISIACVLCLGLIHNNFFHILIVYRISIFNTFRNFPLNLIPIIYFFIHTCHFSYNFFSSFTIPIFSWLPQHSKTLLALLTSHTVRVNSNNYIGTKYFCVLNL